VTEQERTALVLAALDAAIANLSTVRDLLAMALLGGMEILAVEAPQDGSCPHANTVNITTMGSGEPARLCVDCEEVLG
jgi:hypothetical protein